MLFGWGAVVVIAATMVSVFFIHPPVPTRVGVAVVGNPTVVFSYDPFRQAVTAVGIPPDVSVDLTRGYGTYPLSSVWKLDGIDKRKGLVYTETLEEAVGFPVRFFIHPLIEGSGSETILTRIRNALSLSSCIRAFLQKKRTNIPPWLLVKMSRAIYAMNPTDMTFFDLAAGQVFATETQPDGTQIKKIDGGKLSLLLGTHAEDGRIRKENLRISVFNTTQSSGLAQKMTRVIETLGLHVSSIANDESVQQPQCIIRAGKETKESVTVKTLLWLYGCAVEEEATESQYDAAFIIGTDFEKRFFPY